MSSSNYRKKENKNTRALFSIICLCIISLGLIVYFSTSRENNNPVNEPTTIVETTEVQHAVTVKETTTQEETTQNSAENESTTVPTSMPLSDSNTPYKSYYQYPLGEEIIKGYTQELVKDNTMGDFRAHTAVDFSGSEGDEVVAINDGLVLDVYNDAKYGLCVEIDHGGELVARYCGLESANVKKGDFIDIGNPIGNLGSIPCESADGIHLHFVTFIGSDSVNPLDVMGKTE